MQQQDYKRRSSHEETVIDPTFPPPSRLNTGQQAGAGKGTEKRKKKEKKWSLGGLFRRKKNKDTTDTDSSPSTEEEVKKGFLERRRTARKKRNRGSKDVTGSFEHVIIKTVQRQNEEVNHLCVPRDVSSDRNPSRLSNESLNKKQCQESSFIRGSSVSLEGTGRRGGRHQVKARVEATRDRLCADSSSDEGGSSRHSTSSVQRYRSDENLGSKDSSLSRRSRAARTERYIKRLSRDEEAFKEFNLDSSAARVSRSDEKLTNKKSEVKVASGNKWTAKVVYQESSDYDTKYTAKTKSATPSPIQSPKIRPKNALHCTTSAPAAFQNYTTFPPSHTQREGVTVSHISHSGAPVHKILQKPVPSQNVIPPRPPKSSNSEVINRNNMITQKQYPSRDHGDVFNQKSASFESNINHSQSFNKSISHPHPSDSNILVVQFPIARPTLNRKEVKDIVCQTRPVVKQNPPPPPPPRDPQRKIFHLNGNQGETTNARPMSYAFESRGKPKINKSIDYNSNISVLNYNGQGNNNGSSYFEDFQNIPSIKQHHRSNSDQQLPSYNNYLIDHSPPAQRRTASVLARSPPVDVPQSNKIPRHYQYYTDQQPRSRKPIHISLQNQKPNNDQPYLSDSQMVIKPPYQQITRARPVQHATEFWRQKEQESGMKIHLSNGSPKLIQKHLQNVNISQERNDSASSRHDNNVINYTKPRLPPLVMPVRGTDSTSSLSGQSDLSASPRVGNFKLGHNEIGIPVYDSEPVDCNKEQRPLSMVLEKSESSEHEPLSRKDKPPPTPPTRRCSKSTVGNNETVDDNEQKQNNRSSSNLEEALSELEAIYKSLRLGEEALLEKAESRDLSADSRLDPASWSAWVQSRGFESDSSFNYSHSSIDSSSVDSPLRKRLSGCRKSNVPDRVTDDMAYRRLNKKDRAPSLEQNVISQAGSFLLVSPTLSPPPFVEPPPPIQPTQEPDITLDDVVYRNIKHVNNTLKITDPQPPFGIPLGPISPAPNSDYLHVIPKERYRSTFKPRKTPDVITDDLAFRNLRKDNTKDVPMFTPEDTSLLDTTSLRKKRAVRSLSANLISIINKETYSKYLNNNKCINNNNVNNDLEKSQSFTDLPDALTIAHRILDEKENLSNLLKGKNRYKRSISGDDSDITPRVSKCSDISSLGVSTSTETLTDSRANLQTKDPSKRSSQNYGHIAPRSRLSATPERKTESGGVLNLTNNQSSIHLSANQNRGRYSLTPDRVGSGQNISQPQVSQSNLIVYKNNNTLTQSESELLDVLAREARATSEQIGRELKELSHEKREKIVQQNQETSHSNKTNLTIGKVVHHRPVRLNTFNITEDNVLENKTIISNKPVEEMENSRSMTDLLKELTRSLDSDFGNVTTDENTKSTSPSVSSRHSILDEEKPQVFESNTSNNNESNCTKRTTKTESDKEISGDSNSECVNTICKTASSLSELSTNNRDKSDANKCTNKCLANVASSSSSSFQDFKASENKKLLNDDPNYKSQQHYLVSKEVTKNKSDNEEDIKIIDVKSSVDENDKCSDVVKVEDESCSSPKHSPPSSKGDQKDQNSSCQTEVNDCVDCSTNEGTKLQTRCRLSDPSTVILLCSYCMACAHQLAGLDCLTILGLLLAMASVILFLIT